MGETEDQYWDDPAEVIIEEVPTGKQRRQRGLKKSLFFLVPVLLLATTQSGAITLSNGKVEFGLGVLGLKSCTQSSNIQVTQKSTYTISGFALKTITMSNIPISCYGYDLIISVLKPGANGSTDLASLFSTVKKLYIYDRNGTFYTSVSDSSYVSLTSTHDGMTNTDAVTITFTSPSLLVSDFGTLGVESSQNILTSLPCGSGGDCTVGAVGPGGGVVVVYFNTPFTASGSPCNTNCYGLEIKGADNNKSDIWAKTSGNVNANGDVSAVYHGIGAGYLNTKLAITSPNGSNNSSAAYGAVAACWNKTTASPNDRWYLPSVMEYAYLFKQVRESSAFRNAATGFPAVTNYYSSEEAQPSFTIASYNTFFSNDGPPAGVTLAGQVVGTPGPTYALAIAPMNASSSYTNSTFSDFSQMYIFNHPKNNGYAYICMHAFG